MRAQGTNQLKPHKLTANIVKTGYDIITPHGNKGNCTEWASNVHNAIYGVNGRFFSTRVQPDVRAERIMANVGKIMAKYLTKYVLDNPLT